MEKRVAKIESDRKDLEGMLANKESDFNTMQELKDRLSKAEARVLVAENELSTKEKTYQAEIARLRGESGAAPVSMHPADLARLAVLFSLSSLSNASSGSQLSLSASLPTSILGEVDLKLDQTKPINVNLHSHDDDMDAEGELDEAASSSAKTASMRLTLQRPAQAVNTRRSRAAAAAASNKETRFNGQLELTSAPSDDSAQRWGFKLSLGQEA